MEYFVYILRTSGNTLYTGQTNDLKKRIGQHRQKKVGAKYLRRFESVELVHWEKFETRSEAMRREVEIKRWPKTRKELLVKSSMIKIRKYRPADYLQLKSVLEEAQLYDEGWDSKENIAGIKDVLVVVSDKSVVGTLFLVPFGAKVVFLFRLAVKKEFRGQGIATRLMNYAYDLLKKQGVKEVGLFVNSGKKTLLKF